MEEVTVSEAAAILGLSPAGVRRRIKRGDMKARAVTTRLFLIPRREVEKWQRLGRLAPGRKKKRRRAPAAGTEKLDRDGT